MTDSSIVSLENKEHIKEGKSKYRFHRDSLYDSNDALENKEHIKERK